MISKIFLLLLPVSLWAQSKTYPYRAQTLHDVAVYRDADFDSPVIAQVPGGTSLDVSSKLFKDAFFRVRVRPGVLGYIADTDLKPFFEVAGKKKGKPLAARTPRKKQRSFEFTQLAGVQYALIPYKEETMGGTRDENLGFIGAKVSGPNLLVEGAMPTEMNFLFHAGAPGYYQKLTGNSADGWIFIMDFLWENDYPQSKNTMTFWGFGPLLRYSKFSASLTDVSTGKTTDYSLEDVGVGAAFNAGIAVRWHSVALRGEGQYYWEKQQYLAGSLSVQFAF